MRFQIYKHGLWWKTTLKYEKARILGVSDICRSSHRPLSGACHSTFVCSLPGNSLSVYAKRT